MSTKFSALELELFVAHTCARCFQADEAAKRTLGQGNGCPHRRRAVERDQMPGAWTRRRNGPLGETFKCDDFALRPPIRRRATVEADTMAMFDVDEAPITLIPVEGWPDYRAAHGKSKDGDHQ